MTQQGELRLDHNERLAKLRARLLVLAKEMLDDDERRADSDVGSYGVTFADVRIVAETRGYTHEDEFTGRDLSFGASVMREAGGTACERRVSRHRKAKCREVDVFRKLPKEAKPARRAPQVPQSRYPGWSADLVSGSLIHSDTGCRVNRHDLITTANVAQLLADRLKSHNANLQLADR